MTASPAALETGEVVCVPGLADAEAVARLADAEAVARLAEAELNLRSGSGSRVAPRYSHGE
ncbi:hypothetical protein ROS62_27005 [Streptomyces sp. DSM 41972]|uniref:Uncharacterized protein n=1 Tax=Streptomyces althioticus subsp. attaecolombicae TaxID=3075534 RepID=A0ABU3I5V3_9ACTN|nr:hypothetical protein [Streptomyces sp. DSM 41972]